MGLKSWLTVVTPDVELYVIPTAAVGHGAFQGVTSTSHRHGGERGIPLTRYVTALAVVALQR